MTENEQIFWNRVLELAKSQLKQATYEFFVLDDNGGNSIDSRHFGCINKRNIVGKMIYLFFPLPSIGKIN